MHLLQPALTSGHTLTQYSYNLDKQLTQVLRPDSQIIQLNYGAVTGLLHDMQTPRGGFLYSYNPTTAQLSTMSTPEGETLTYRYDGELPTGNGGQFQQSNICANLKLWLNHFGWNLQAPSIASLLVRVNGWLSII